jgi:hypothetical protein
MRMPKSLLGRTPAAEDNERESKFSPPLHTVAKHPETYQDAIEFAQSLGIRYLWIDSLCIIVLSVQARLPVLFCKRAVSSVIIRWISSVNLGDMACSLY